MTPQEATRKFHWVHYNKQTNTIELFLDHYMLSGLRTCEARFYLQHIALVTPRYEQGMRKPWFLDFGEYLHWCLELFYHEFKERQQAPVLDTWVDKCKEKWQVMKLEEYKYSPVERNRKCYDEVGEWEGVCGLLIEYYAYYMNMRMRVIDTEITFGHDREVFLGRFELPQFYTVKVKKKAYEKYNNIHVDCYLTGRIDLLADNGYKIGPIDHKHTHRFRGDEHDKFNPHDAITGYILGAHEILKLVDPDLAAKRPVLSSWIQHISACLPSTPRDKTKSPGPRFKTTPVDKMPQQLEEYKIRQLSTFKRIAELVFNNDTPQWNTLSCDNIFMRPCEYKAIHASPSSSWFHIIQDHYEVGKSWDTREHGMNTE